MNILLHICCTNCALYPIELFRSEGHSLSGFWFNPNIHPREEYNLRLNSLKKIADNWKVEVMFREEYQPDLFFDMFKSPPPPFSKGGQGGITGDKEMPESINASSIPPFPERCKSCYDLRLEETAKEAAREGFNAFTTTLLISPYQSFGEIESIGQKLADEYNVEFLPRDFRPYFRDAMALSKELGLYRQKYCGCIFSREERKTGKS